MTATTHQRIIRTVDVAAAPDDVWAVVGDFAGIHVWHPFIPDSAVELVEGAAAATVPGTLRRFTDGHGGEMTERLLEHSDADRRLRYDIPSTAPQPELTHHFSEVVVEPIVGGSRFTWIADVTGTDEAVAGLTAVVGDGVFAAGAAAIGDRFGRVTLDDVVDQQLRDPYERRR